MVVINAYSNPIMTVDANISRGLWEVIPLTRLVKYPVEDESKMLMTLVKATTAQ